jgi:hypothetical protein
MQRKNLAPLTGVLFVALVLVAFFALGGNTPDGKDSAHKVVSFYSDNHNKETAAAIVLALAGVPLLYFSALIRDKGRAAVQGRSALPGFAFAGGVVAAAGFMTAATLHFALADYADNIQPAAAQAINAIDNDFFAPFAFGLLTLVLATSLMTVRSGLLPKWLGWVGIVLFVIAFTPAGFIAFGLGGIWVIVVSILFYVRGEGTAAGGPPAQPAVSSPV